MNIFKPTLACMLLAASCVVSAETRLVLKSDPGDFVGQGKKYLYTDTNSVFRFSKYHPNGIILNVTTADDWWILTLLAPNNAILQPGSYNGAMRGAFKDADKPGLDFSGNGRGCNQLTGRFDIFEISYDSQGVVNGINVSFEQHCEGATPALRGQLSYNLVPPMGIASFGVSPKGYTCLNRNSGQRLNLKSTATLVDCKKAGLQINPGDIVTISITGIAE